MAQSGTRRKGARGMQRSKSAVIVVAVCLVVTVAAVAYAAAKAKAVPVQEVVRAKRFELVDSLGRTRAVLGIVRTYDGNEEVSLSLVGRGGSIVAELRTERVGFDSGELRLHGQSAKGHSLARLSGGVLGSPLLTLENTENQECYFGYTLNIPLLKLEGGLSDGENRECLLGSDSLSFQIGARPVVPEDVENLTTEETERMREAFAARHRISLGLDSSKDGLPSLTLCDKNGTKRASLEANALGGPALDLRDDTGRICASLVGERVRMLALYDRNSKASAGIGVSPDTGPWLRTCDRDGKVLWSAP